MLSATINIIGLDTTSAKFDALAISLQDFSDALTGLGVTLIEYFSTAPFITRGDVLGTPWAALKDSTIKAKNRDAANGITGIGAGASTPLIRTGALQRGFQARAEPMSLFVDNSVDYWKYHEAGTGEMGNASIPPEHPGRGLNLPRRQTLGLTDDVKDIITAVIGAEVDAKIVEVIS